MVKILKVEIIPDNAAIILHLFREQQENPEKLTLLHKLRIISADKYNIVLRKLISVHVLLTENSDI